MALILFDYDGVLADTLSDLLQFGQEACDELGVRHTATQADLNGLEVMSFATYGQKLEVPEALIDEFVQRCLKKFSKKQTPPDIFAGLEQVVKKLAANNILAIITSNNTHNVGAFLLEHGIAGQVRAIFGVDSPGTKAEKIALARSQFAENSGQVFMVGDAVSDIYAAQEATVKSIGVSWGHQTAEKLALAKPDYLVYSPEELLGVITRATK